MEVRSVGVHDLKPVSPSVEDHDLRAVGRPLDVDDVLERVRQERAIPPVHPNFVNRASVRVSDPGPVRRPRQGGQVVRGSEGRATAIRGVDDE